MLEEELKNIWKNSHKIDQIKFETSRLIIELDHRLKTLNKSIKNRDRREIIASILGMFVFGYFLYEVPFITSKIASGIAILWFGYVIYRLKKVQQFNKPIAYTRSFHEQLNHQKKHLLKQIDLLNNVLYWYVLPPFIMNLIFLFGLKPPETVNWTGFLSEHIPYNTTEKLMFIGFNFLISIGIVWLNKRAVSKTLKPAVDEINKALTDN